MDSLDGSRFSNNTLILVTSDNGYHLGEKHHYGKSMLWEKSAKVPLLVRLPEKKNAGLICEKSVGLIDIFPTLVTAARLPKTTQQLDGRDLAPLFEDPDTEWPFPAITTYGENRFSARSERWRYIRYPDGEEELYDHRKDPHEWENFTKDPETEEVRERYRALIPDAWTPSIGGRKG